jgi:hypothetical protein
MISIRHCQQLNHVQITISTHARLINMNRV